MSQSHNPGGGETHKEIAGEEMRKCNGRLGWDNTFLIYRFFTKNTKISIKVTSLTAGTNDDGVIASDSRVCSSGIFAKETTRSLLAPSYTNTDGDELKKDRNRLVFLCLSRAERIAVESRPASFAVNRCVMTPLTFI